jgi:hypothetical protein
VNLAATVILLATAVAADHIGLRIFLALAACGAALTTAVRFVALLHYWRFANRNAKPS